MYTLRTLPNTIKIVKRNTSGIIGIVSNYKCLEKILYRSKKEIIVDITWNKRDS